MKENKLHDHIKNSIEAKKSKKRFRMGDTLVYTIVTGVIALAVGEVGNFFDHGMFFTPGIYKWYFILCPTIMVIILCYIFSFSTIAKDSEIKKKAERLLEEFTSFEESACDDYSLFDEIRIKSREDVLWVISELRELLGIEISQMETITLDNI